MSSEQLADGVNPLDAELAATWDVLKGYSGRDTDLGIGRRFGGAAAAYSLRDIGAMNGRVVKVRRDSGETTDPEEDFSANQVQDGTLERWVNGELESTLPADVSTAAAAYSLRKVKADYSGDAVRIRRSSDDIEVNVAFDSDDKVSASSAITNVAEQGGESGQTTDTTLGDFISGTDAFVHTWYDQAGSNDAVQATAANQPKIAESGALLDGIKFSSASDGTSATHLDIATKLMDSTDGFMSSVINSVQDMNQLGVIYGNRNNNSGFVFGIHQAEYPQVFYRQSSGANRLENTDFILSSSSKYLLSVDKDGTNDANLFGNAVSRDTDSSMNYITSTGSTSKIGQGGNTVTSDANGLNANINELIFYNSDQADNRFKIESNINNYYGLYNDANETNGDFDKTFSPTADGTFTPNGKDGFTLAVVSSTVYAGIKLNEDVASGDSIYVSFNCSFDAGSPSPKIVLRDTDSDFFGGGTLMSNEESVVNGFNSFTLTSTNSSASGVVFSEADNNLTYTIYNFKVSRIARNGFVETLYDQSGNGRDMVQDTAGYQPRIVRNGGQVKDPSGYKPSVNFGLKGTGQGGLHLKLSSNVPQASSNTLTALFVASLDIDTVTAPRLSAAAIDFNLSSSEVLQTRFGNNRTSTPNLTVSTFDNSFIGFTVNSSLVPKYYLDNSAASTASAHSGTGTPTVFQILGENAIGGDTLDRYHWSGTISEAILYLTDLDSDIEDFKNNINNYYKVF